MSLMTQLDLELYRRVGAGSWKVYECWAVDAYGRRLARAGKKKATEFDAVYVRARSQEAARVRAQKELLAMGYRCAAIEKVRAYETSEQGGRGYIQKVRAP